MLRAKDETYICSCIGESSTTSTFVKFAQFASAEANITGSATSVDAQVDAASVCVFDEVGDSPGEMTFFRSQGVTVTVSTLR